MAYICLDCSNKSSKQFPGGRCPACDSFNIKTTHKKVDNKPQRKKKTFTEIIIMSSLWFIFIYGAYQHYFDEETPFEDKPLTLQEFLQ